MKLTITKPPHVNPIGGFVVFLGDGKQSIIPMPTESTFEWEVPSNWNISSVEEVNVEFLQSCAMINISPQGEQSVVSKNDSKNEKDESSNDNTVGGENHTAKTNLASSKAYKTIISTRL